MCQNPPESSFNIQALGFIAVIMILRVWEKVLESLSLQVFHVSQKQPVDGYPLELDEEY